ncbi:hypothetical protein FHS61_002961 [Altererythrobacter atlanticus]|nr:hypothetical protein [Croceibacterium atlanticum]
MMRLPACDPFAQAMARGDERRDGRANMMAAPI